MDLPGYDAWKTTPPEWHMPYWLQPDENELARMYRNYELTPFFDGDESLYEWLCEERDELARIDAHEREPDDEDFEEVAPCSLGVGCDEYGVCYAAAHGQPDMCDARR